MKNTLIRSLGAAALIVTLGASGAFASEIVSEETRAQVTEKLTAEGYEVRKLKMEDGMLEAYVIKDGKKMELIMDADLNVTKTKSAD